jgi:alkanesulfonate monooxygenase SsuD/methylene tetrahydromethanopterin reductase-like flavin-dependent oxidoreductase (luciferase family)
MTSATRTIKFGICGLGGQSVDPTPEGFHEELDRVVAFGEQAERDGLDSVWLTEHHFAEDGYLPSPWVALAAVARGTDRVRLGTNVALPPMHDPLRLAEDTAVLDQLSRGRLTVGFGLGYRRVEFRALGVDPSQRVARLCRSVEVLRDAWSGKPIAGVGLLDPDEAVEVRPLPYQAGGPPILIGAIAEAGIRRARRIGDGFIGPTVNESGTSRRLGWLAEEGPLDDFAIVLSVSVFVAAHGAWSIASPGVAHVEGQYRRWLYESGDLPQLEGRPWNEEGGDARPPHFVAGTPGECAAALSGWCRLLESLPGSADAQLVVRLTYPGLARKDCEESIRLFATEVVPRLRAGAA